MHQGLFLLLYTFSVAYLFSGIYVLVKDRKSIKNRLFFCLCICASCWALGYAFMYIAPNEGAAFFWRQASALGYCFIYGIWLDFSITIRYENERKLGYKGRAFIYLPAVLFYVHNLSYSPNQVIVKINNGWSDIFPVNIVEIMFIIYYVITVISGIVIIYKWGKNAISTREKKQSQILILGTSISFILAALTDTVFPFSRIIIFPSGIIAISIAMVGAWYAITKYKMMTLTPEYASNYIFKAVNDPIFFIGEDLSIKNANNKALNMAGYGFKEIRKIFLSQLIEERNFSFSSLLRENTINILEVNLISRNGVKTECSLSGVKIFDEYNDLLGIIIVLQDISERNKAERILKDYNLELESRIIERTAELEKANNAKSEFLANVSHELRTPLNVILSTIQIFGLYIANDSMYKKENAVKHLKSMKQNCFRLIRLVNNILDTTKISAGHFELHMKNQDIINIVKTITESVEGYVKQRGLTLIFHSKASEKIIACDLNAVERILLNLLSNAIKFSKVNGNIAIGIIVEETYILISVKDDGIGIDKDMQENIFERFRQAESLLTRENEGSGIGLAITKNLVEMQGGIISIKSEVGKGSEFIISLPINLIEESNVTPIFNNDSHALIERINVEFSDIYNLK
jgi:PAS domain S-box-containing protein